MVVLVENVTIMDENLASLGKIILPIKADGHCLPRAIYTGTKTKQLLPSSHSYKQLFGEAVHDIISFDKHNEFIADTELETVYQLQQYEEKIYNSNIVDMV